MQALLDVQLNFEFQRTRPRPILSCLTPKLAMLYNQSKHISIELWDEYEKKLSLFSGGQATLALAQLRELEEFIADHRAGADFDKFLKHPFHKLVAALQKLIVA